jgi:hypothetical protein
MTDRAFTVQLSDLTRVAGDFTGASNEMYSLMGGRAPYCPPGGDNAIDRILDVTPAEIDDVRVILSDVFQQHGSNLRFAADNYQAAEQYVRPLAQTVTESSDRGPHGPMWPNAQLRSEVLAVDKAILAHMPAAG